MTTLLEAFAADRSGATAVEYGTLVGGIAIAVMLVVERIGLSAQGTFLELKTIFTGSAPPAARS
jgi:Flp pilus assembly pilin Flp